MASKYRVMVVEDNTGVLHMINRALGEDDYETMTANTALSAIQQFNSTIDLVITDFEMPDFNAHHLIESLKEISPVPIIVMTAHRYVKVGRANALLFKPFSMEQLQNTARKLLKDKNSSQNQPMSTTS